MFSYCPAGLNNNSLQMIQLMLTYLRIPATKLYSLLIPVFISILNLNYLLYHQNLCFTIHDKKETGDSALTKSPAINLIYFFTHLHAVLGIDFIQTYPNNSFAAFSSSLLSCVLSYPPFQSSIPLIRFKENNPLRLQ